jgi:hypothetical protein
MHQDAGGTLKSHVPIIGWPDALRRSKIGIGRLVLTFSAAFLPKSDILVVKAGTPFPKKRRQGEEGGVGVYSFSWQQPVTLCLRIG